MYVTIELQTFADGSLHPLVIPTKGHDPEKSEQENYNDALSEYHNVLKYAAISELPCHGAVVLRFDGLQIAGQCYRHGTEPGPVE